MFKGQQLMVLPSGFGLINTQKEQDASENCKSCNMISGKSTDNERNQRL